MTLNSNPNPITLNVTLTLALNPNPKHKPLNPNPNPNPNISFRHYLPPPPPENSTARMFSILNLGLGKKTELRERESNSPNPNPKLVDESGDQEGTGTDSSSPLLKKNEFLKSESEPNQDAAWMREGCVDKATPLQTEGNLSRTQILSFFEAATKRMRDPEVRRSFILCSFFFSSVHIGIDILLHAAITEYSLS